MFPTSASRPLFLVALKVMQKTTRTNSPPNKSTSLRVEALRSWNCSNFETLLLCWATKHIIIGIMNQHGKLPALQTPTSSPAGAPSSLKRRIKFGAWAPADSSSHYIPSIYGMPHTLQCCEVMGNFSFMALSSTCFIFFLPFRSFFFFPFPTWLLTFPAFEPRDRSLRAPAMKLLVRKGTNFREGQPPPRKPRKRQQFCTWLGWYGRGDLKGSHWLTKNPKIQMEIAARYINVELVAYVGGLIILGIVHERIVRTFLGYLPRPVNHQHCQVPIIGWQYIACVYLLYMYMILYICVINLYIYIQYMCVCACYVYMCLFLRH